MPSSQADKSLSFLHPNKDGSLSLKYEPREAGVHEVCLNLNDQGFDGPQLRVNVGKLGKFVVTSYGPGLYQGLSGKKTHFHVTRPKEMKKDLVVKVDGPEKAEATIKEEKNGWIGEYTPLTPGEYVVDMKIGDESVPGSPFTAKISGQGTKKTYYLVSGPGDYPLDADTSDLTGIIAYVKPPQGTLIQAHLKISEHGKLTLTNFKPRLSGKYVVDVIKNGHKFQNSPYEIKVKDDDLCDPTKVKVSGKVKDALANQNSKLVLDISKAGYGDLALTMEGPYRVEMADEGVNDPQHIILNYNPPETGTYILGVKYGGEHVKDSPFVVEVGGKGRGNVRQASSIDVSEVEMMELGKEIDLFITLPGCSALDLEASVTDPNGESELCEVRDQPGGKFVVRLVPSEKGLHIISLKLKGVHVNGSPLPFTVGGSIIGGPHRVEFGGMGAKMGVAGVKNEFNIYTREAGPGSLTLSVDGPSKSSIHLKDTQTGFVYVMYTVDKEGEYNIGIKFDGVHVPRSPFTVQVDPDCPAAKKLSIHGLRDRGLELEKPATFSINTNGNQGEITSYLMTPAGVKDEVTLESIDTDEYMIRFIPKENGVYYVAVKFNNCHIPGSPLPMLVGKLGADPALVVMEGKGLKSGHSGTLSKFNIGTVKAGSGPLQIQIEGPARVPISCGDLDDGYEVSYTPPVLGLYSVSVKFCNVLVPGCPFIARVTGLTRKGGLSSDTKELSGITLETQEKKGGVKKVLKGDATKVVVQGPGMKKAFAGRAANFTIEVKDAGFALLSVAIVSPKGLPVKELSCKKQKPGIYQCIFTPDEKGEHQLVVRWGQDDVPGSPFLLKIG